MLRLAKFLYPEPRKEINLITTNDAFIDHKANGGFPCSKSEDPIKSFPLPSVWSVFNMIKESVKIFEEFVCCAVRCEMELSRRTEKSNLFVKSKTNLIKKRTRRRSTCQAFPCDNQYRAVDTTLSWSAWGMVRLLTIARKKTNDYISATEYMQFSIR